MGHKTHRPMPRVGAAGAALLVLAAALLAVGLDSASAKRADARLDRRPQPPGKPVLAIVSLNDQRVSIYDAHSKILEAPVSTGSAGYETPAGIFSIVQKKEMHSSNLYEDGQMPFMQRITWTGIALHAGTLPGRPASHGCIRLPFDFAQRLFDLTDLGMRVLVVRDDMGPSEVDHPRLFKSNPVRPELAAAVPSSDRSLVSKTAPGARLAAADAGATPGSARHLQILQSNAAAKAAEAEAAAKSEREAKQAAATKAAAAASAARSLRATEANVTKADTALKQAERRLETASSPQVKQQAETAKAKLVARMEELQGQLQTVRLQEQANREAAEQATEAARAAAAMRDSAAQAAEEAERKTLPVSVFISRKTQRLYVRKGNYPIYEGPLAIRDPQAPLGTFVFTALDHVGTAGEMRWNVVAMYKNPTHPRPSAPEQPRQAGARTTNTAATDVAPAKAALDRVTFSQEALDLISEVVWPNSSLIISDEGPSRETGKDTDFVVVMSGEPQGALKIRQREPMQMDGWGRPFRGLPFFWN
jgi:L,D-transpeptidase catalytic domain